MKNETWNGDITTWKKEIEDAFEDTKDTWNDVIENTLSEEELNCKFDGGFGGSRGTPFTLWTKIMYIFPLFMMVQSGLVM